MAKSETAVQKAEAMKNPWTDMVETMIRSKSKSEQPTEYYNVNGHKYFVPKDVVTRVPRPVYDLMKNQMEAEKAMHADAKENFTGDRVPTFTL